MQMLTLLKHPGNEEICFFGKGGPADFSFSHPGVFAQRNESGNGFVDIVHCVSLLCRSTSSATLLPPPSRSPPPPHPFLFFAIVHRLLICEGTYVPWRMEGRQMPWREGRECTRAGIRGRGGQGLMKMVDGLWGGKKKKAGAEIERGWNNKRK